MQPQLQLSFAVEADSSNWLFQTVKEQFDAEVARMKPQFSISTALQTLENCIKRVTATALA